MARRSPRKVTNIIAEEDSSWNHSDLITGWSTLIISLTVGVFLFWHNGVWDKFSYKGNYGGFEYYYLLNIVSLLFPAFFLIFYILKRDLKDFGLAPGDLKLGLIIALGGFACFIPVLLIVGPQQEFQDYYLSYQLGDREWGGSRAIQGMRYINEHYQGTHLIKGHYEGGRIAWDRLLFHEAVMGFYMLAWEWFFRGFMLNGLKKIMPIVLAAVLQAGLFCVLHLGKPPIETISSFFGGCLLAFVAIRCKSMLPCFLIHWLISMSFDFIVLFNHLK
jgi:membrane protease YdiL (CAAX protease family)